MRSGAIAVGQGGKKSMEEITTHELRVVQILSVENHCTSEDLYAVPTLDL